LPINKLSADTTFTLASNNLYSHAATLSFWAFIEDSSVFADNTIRVAYENRIKIWIGQKSATKIAAWCIPRPNFYQNIADLAGKNLQNMTTKTQLEAQKADTEKNVLFGELGANKDKLWFNVRCAYTITDKKQYLVLHNKDISDEKKDGPKTMKVHNYVETEEVDFPFRDFSSNNKIIIQNGGVTTTNILLRNIVAHIDYVPDVAKYEYF
jgi:hypothetical protein